MSTPGTEAIGIRRAQPADDPAVLRLLRASLGKEEDRHYEAFLHWKHQESPFGVSPAWVATDGDRVVGYRTFLRWRFRQGEKLLRAVRAVDTATDPGYRGRGIFRSLTLQAIADLTLERQGFVFNTPNDQSRPGYLAMGWRTAGRVPVGVQLAGPGSMGTMRAARVPALLWSEPTSAGMDAREALADRARAEALLQHAGESGVHTDRTPEYLAWRTAFAPLGYRLLQVSEHDPAQGGIIFRVRRRGAALEAAIIELLVPDLPSGARLVRRVLSATGADYAIGVRDKLSGGLVPLPRQGPLLTTRPLAGAAPESSQWRFSLGDIELF